jgi:cob(I)alamin adenosyltransferase
MCYNQINLSSIKHYLVQILHDIFATGLEVRKERNLVTDLLKIVKSQMQTYRPERTQLMSFSLPKQISTRDTRR